MEQKIKPFLVGVTAQSNFIGYAKEKIEKGLRKGSNNGVPVGVEYTAYHYQSEPRNEQDIFWKKIIDFLKSKGCKIVFLDDHNARLGIDRQHESKKLNTELARMVFKRETAFERKIPLTKLSILGAAHAIRLQQKMELPFSLDLPSSIMHEKGLIPLTHKALLDSKASIKRHVFLDAFVGVDLHKASGEVITKIEERVNRKTALLLKKIKKQPRQNSRSPAKRRIPVKPRMH